MAKKIPQIKETKKLQSSIATLIGTLLSSGFTQQELADNLQLYQPEVSQLYRKVRVFKDERFKEIEKILKKLVDTNTEEQSSNSVKPEYTYGTWLYDQLTNLEITPIEFAEKANLSYQAINLIISGTTSNPQPKTKNLIQSALDQLSKDRKTKIEKINIKDIENEERLFIGIPFTENDIRGTPDKIGVYAIHDRRGYPTYIGKGKIQTRLKDHREKTAFASNKVATSFSYYIIQVGEDEKDANKQAKLWEKVLTKFAGNTLLLNVQNSEDLSREGE